MAILGISGLFSTEFDDYDPTTFYEYSHDATACIVAGGTTLAAVEEERLTRDKHTFRFPENAVRACLDISGLRPADITGIAYYFGEDYLNVDLARIAADDPHMCADAPREQLRRRISEAAGYEFDSNAMIFVPHHDTHAASAFYDSGLTDSLVVVSDGNAERDGISIYLADGNGLKLLHSHSRTHSLGHFYTAITKILGYRNFDEYKVMGLASFGDPSVYRRLFNDLYQLDADGSYTLPYEAARESLLAAGFTPRRAGQEITQMHKDLAASAQEVLERISLHLISHWVQHTGSVNLCLAGGVAQNTTLNGKLLGLSTLRSVFVPPAAHDGGAALGAAIIADRRDHASESGHRYSSTVYLGSAVESGPELKTRVSAWSDFVTSTEVDSAEETAADCLASNEVVAWVQGRAEFGPRALGNRSILADPRPASNRDRVNRLIKKREDYRPFAPVVTSADAGTFFDLPAVSADYSYMGFVVPVREQYREFLGATTHVDGTARVQVIDEDANPRYWALIKQFEKRTGTPVLLNTSYNNSS